jgi:hypothetical protein
MHRGRFDPRSLTAGARGPHGRPRWLVANCPRPWRTGSRPAHRRRRQGTRKAGKRPSWTGSSPGSHLQGRLGQRRTGSDEFGGGELEQPGEKRQRAAAIPATSGRFRQGGGRGQQGGPAGHTGEARGGAERQR